MRMIIKSNFSAFKQNSSDCYLGEITSLAAQATLLKSWVTNVKNGKVTRRVSIQLLPGVLTAVAECRPGRLCDGHVAPHGRPRAHESAHARDEDEEAVE